MSKLGFILQHLVDGAQVDRPATTRLPSGLNVTARLTREGLRCLSLTRTETQKPSEKEAQVCADHLGWKEVQIVSSTTRTGKPCLLVWPNEKKKTAASASPTCGSCDHWTPTSPSMGECQLGWEAHDNLRDSKGKPTTGGHGGLPLPETQAGCSCAATVGNQLGYVARRQAQ